MREREEKKKRGGREEVSIDRIVLTHSLTQLWLLNVVRKDRGAQNFRVSEYYAVLLLTTDCYYEPNAPDNQQNFPSHSSKSSHEQ